MIFVNMFCPSVVLHMFISIIAYKTDNLQYKTIFTIFLFASLRLFL